MTFSSLLLLFFSIGIVSVSCARVGTNVPPLVAQGGSSETKYIVAFADFSADDRDTKLESLKSELLTFMENRLDLSKRPRLFRQRVDLQKTFETYSFGVSDIPFSWKPPSIPAVESITVFECIHKWPMPKGCLMGCQAKDVRSQTMLTLSFGCAIDNGETSAFRDFTNTHTPETERNWCELDSVGNLGRLDRGMYSGNTLVPLAIQMCEWLGYRLQRLTDAAEFNIVAIDPSRPENRKKSGVDLSLLTALRKGLAYYSRFGFIPCDYSIDDWCEECDAYRTYVIPAEEDFPDGFVDYLGKYYLKTLQEGRITFSSAMRSCLLHIYCNCQKGDVLGICIQSIFDNCPKSLPPTPATPDQEFESGIIALFIEKIARHFEGKVPTKLGYIERGGSFCRKSAVSDADLGTEVYDEVMKGGDAALFCLDSAGAGGRAPTPEEQLHTAASCDRTYWTFGTEDDESDGEVQDALDEPDETTPLIIAL